ncbi:MAG: VOC family protein [Thermoanaerobaculia bacterium]|nr:VOC family protein [Thermoanaerobaculia bacterium]MBP9822984.1 VOC family protein [Thermoanaerobaculia bacterium]
MARQPPDPGRQARQQVVLHPSRKRACGWCKDRWGLNWQITLRVLIEAPAAGGTATKRAFAAIEAARRG